MGMIECKHGYDACPVCDRPSVPTISAWQPWASLIFTGDKLHDTRAYPPPDKHIGKRIGIHAAKLNVHDSDLSLGMQLLLERNWGGNWRQALPRGVIMGTVRLVGATLTELVTPTKIDGFCGNWDRGRWAWELAEPQRLAKPVPYRGKQGWFNVDAEVFA